MAWAKSKPRVEALGSSLVVNRQVNRRVNRGLLQAVAPLHPLDTALSVNDPLLSGIKGMALAANLDP